MSFANCVSLPIGGGNRFSFDDVCDGVRNYYKDPCFGDVSVVMLMRLENWDNIKKEN